MTNEMAAAIAGGLIGAGAVVAGSWITAWFTYRYARTKDTEDRKARGKVIASSVLQEIMSAESAISLLALAAEEGNFTVDKPPSPLLDRIETVAEVFTPDAFTALVGFREAYRAFIQSIERAREALELHGTRGSSDETIASIRARAAKLIRSRARDAFGGEADAIDALEKAGGEIPIAYGSTPLALDRGPMAVRLGWTDADLKKMRDETERLLEAQFNGGPAPGQVLEQSSAAEKRDPHV